MHVLEWGQGSRGLCAHTVYGPYLMVAVMESNVPPVKVLGQNALPIITSVHASDSALRA